MDWVKAAEVASLAYLAGVLSVVTPIGIALYVTRNDDKTLEDHH